MLYRNLSGYFKERYGKRVGKICIDGGFTCPNRDGKCGTGGCIFCSERGSGEHIRADLSIAEQVRSQLARGRSEAYVAYFQNYTNTYAPTSVLKERYSAALIDGRIIALAIGTRPDCIDKERAELISSFAEGHDVWVELGLQTASDKTAAVINRGYKTEQFTEAVRLLDGYGIPTVVHIIIGLPGEGERELEETCDLINSLPVWGVKIHSLYVCRDTGLEKLYKNGEYTPPLREEYVRLAARALARLRPDIVVHRITGDCPSELLVAPGWNSDKNGVINEIRRELETKGLRQGSLYGN